jgi:flagellar protein FliT
MSAPQVIANYETLSALTRQMTVAAKEGEWEHLIDLEQQCSHQVAVMKPLDASSTLDEPDRQNKIRLIKEILANDAEIRNRTQTWMTQLQHILQSNQQEQRLQRAYGG